MGDPSFSSGPASPDAQQLRPQPSASLPVDAGLGGGIGGGSPAAAGAAQQQKPTFATAGAELRTTSVPAVAPHGEEPAAEDAVSAAAASTAQPSQNAAPSPMQPPQQQQQAAPPPEGRSDSEDDHLSSPDTTLGWRLPGDRCAAGKHPLPTASSNSKPPVGLEAGAALQPAAGAAADQQPTPGRRLPRTMSREQLQAGSGGRSPPKGAAVGGVEKTDDNGPPSSIPALRLRGGQTAPSTAGAAAPAAAAHPAAAQQAQVWAEGSQYPAHPQAPSRLLGARHIAAGDPSSGGADTPACKAGGSASDIAAATATEVGTSVSCLNFLLVDIADLVWPEYLLQPGFLNCAVQSCWCWYDACVFEIGLDTAFQVLQLPVRRMLRSSCAPTPRQRCPPSWRPSGS